jgi:hypothetical protein
LKEPDLHWKSLGYRLNEPLVYTNRALFALERALVTLQRDLLTPIIYIGHCIELYGDSLSFCWESSFTNIFAVTLLIEEVSSPPPPPSGCDTIHQACGYVTPEVESV